MKIVDVCAFYAPRGGGVKTYIDQKVRAAPDHDVDLTIIAPGEADETIHLGKNSRIRTLKSPPFPLDPAYRYFADEGEIYLELDQILPDVIEVSSPWRSARTVAAWETKAIKALIMHADPLSVYPYRWFERFAARSTVDRWFEWFWQHLRELNDKVDIVVCANPCLTRRLQGGGLTKAETIRMGIASGGFSPALRDEAFRRELLHRCHLPDDGILLLGVGRHHGEKRWPMVVNAVAKAGVRAPVGLILVGSGTTTRAIERARAGNPHVVLLGAVEQRADMARLMASADGLIHGSDAETFCMVAAEARASGLPLIGPDLGGFADHLREGVGFGFAAGDSSGAAQAIGNFVVAGPAGLRSQASARAQDVRSLQAHFSELFARYYELLNDQSTAAVHRV